MSKLKAFIKRTGRDIWSLLTLNTCYACDRQLTEQEQNVCFSCLSQIEQTDFHLCPSDNELFYRFAGKVHLTGATSLFYFDKKGRLSTLIKALKYKNAPPLAKTLGECMGEVLKTSDFAKGIDCIIPVPLHRSKQIKRGYNQAEYIARGLAVDLEIPVNIKVLKRKKKTITQTKKAGSDRWSNVENAFVCIDHPPRKVMLVDDVITTGSTLEACIRALMSSEQPPEEIWIAGLGMARKK